MGSKSICIFVVCAFYTRFSFKTQVHMYFEGLFISGFFMIYIVFSFCGIDSIHSKSKVGNSFLFFVFNNEVSLMVLQRSMQRSSFRSLLVGHLIYFNLILLRMVS